MKKGRGRGTAMKMKQMAIVALILVAFVAPASAATLIVYPSSATVGDDVTIEGTGFDQNGNVTLTTTATCWKPVVDGKCECTMNDFKIPNEDVSFRLSVREVEGNVTLYVKKFIWWTIDHDMLGFHFAYDSTTHTSNVSHGGPIPVGTYKIDVIGDAVDGAENCSMTTTIKKELKANSTGGFKEVIDTQGIPVCNFTINATDESGNSDEATLGLFLLGDASKDGQVNSYDCACIGRRWAEISGYDNTTICWGCAAKINPDFGKLDLSDARCLARYLIGLESSIPCS
ncbi:MAG: hypothetical protein WA977_10135 [Halobacteriota archaeon]